jgi:hypothetical protein
MKRVIVTPAGRSRFLRLLHRHLAAQTKSFDEWHLWLNTAVPEDLQFCNQLAADYPWIKAIPLDVPFNGCHTIGTFFKHYVDPAAMYLRLDDDIVWLEPAFTEKMFAFREARREFFLVFGSIVNNAVLSHIYQRCGVIDYRHGVCGYDCMDAVGWHSPLFARHLHEQLLASIEAGDLDRWRCFPEWRLHLYERVSINAVSFLGEEMATFNGEVPHDEEPWLASVYPAAAKKMCVINGAALCAHFSFVPQRVAQLLNEPGLLAQYEKHAPVIS